MNRPDVEYYKETTEGEDVSGEYAARLIAWIEHLESQLGIAREALDFYRDWATRPYQERDYPHNRFGFVQYDVHRALIDALAKLNNGTRGEGVGAK